MGVVGVIMAYKIAKSNAFKKICNIINISTILLCYPTGYLAVEWTLSLSWIFLVLFYPLLLQFITEAHAMATRAGLCGQTLSGIRGVCVIWPATIYPRPRSPRLPTACRCLWFAFKV